MKKTIFSVLLLVGLLAMAGCRDKTPELELVKDAYGVTQRINPNEKSVYLVFTGHYSTDDDGYFENFDGSLIDWLRQYSADQTETYLRGFLGRMLFSGDEVYKPAKVLSGGEKVRCMLSRLMMSKANALILDQPTDHLDLESITALSNGLQAYPGNLFFASHDHQFIDEIANRIIEFPLGKEGCLDYAGGFEEYLEWKRSRV